MTSLYCDITKSVAKIGNTDSSGWVGGGDEGKETIRKSKSDRLRWNDGCTDRHGSRGNKREKASSRGLAELTVNLHRFIFSGACCFARRGVRFTCLSLHGGGGKPREEQDGIAGLT